jgi:hypothetical protein
MGKRESERQTRTSRRQATNLSNSPFIVEARFDFREDQVGRNVRHLEVEGQIVTRHEFGNDGDDPELPSRDLTNRQAKGKGKERMRAKKKRIEQTRHKRMNKGRKTQQIECLP